MKSKMYDIKSVLDELGVDLPSNFEKPLFWAERNGYFMHGKPDLEHANKEYYYFEGEDALNRLLKDYERVQQQKPLP